MDLANVARRGRLGTVRGRTEVVCRVLKVPLASVTIPPNCWRIWFAPSPTVALSCAGSTPNRNTTRKGSKSRLSVTGMVCIGISAGAYNTEVIRGAVLAVPTGQIEAAKAIGMSTAQRFRRILLPQVARYALPGLGNVWQLTLKETSLISVIGLVEIMRQSAIASGSTKEPFTFYLVAALLYLGLTSVSNRGFNRAEVWASNGVRYG